MSLFDVASFKMALFNGGNKFRGEKWRRTRKIGSFISLISRLNVFPGNDDYLVLRGNEKRNNMTRFYSFEKVQLPRELLYDVFVVLLPSRSEVVCDMFNFEDCGSIYLRFVFWVTNCLQNLRDAYKIWTRGHPVSLN